MGSRAAARVIGIGQPVGGDDAVGLEVLRWLRARGVPPGVELVENVEPTAIIFLLEGAERVVLIDAVVADEPPGRVIELPVERLRAMPGRLLSTHGVGVAEAIGLARRLDPEAIARRIVVVGVTIAGPGRHGAGLSPAVAAAVEPAGLAVLRALGDS